MNRSSNRVLKHASLIINDCESLNQHIHQKDIETRLVFKKSGSNKSISSLWSYFIAKNYHESHHDNDEIFIQTQRKCMLGSIKIDQVCVTLYQNKVCSIRMETMNKGLWATFACLPNDGSIELNGSNKAYLIMSRRRTSKWQSMKVRLFAFVWKLNAQYLSNQRESWSSQWIMEDIFP